MFAVLRELAVAYQRWMDDNGDAEASGIAQRYRELCSTLGHPVRVELGGGTVLTGLAASVDTRGQLVVDGTHISAGDVLHVRR